MKINVRVKTNSKKEAVELREDGSLFVCVNAPAVEGRANERLVELLSKYLKKPKSALRIVMGTKSNKKVVEVLD